MFVTLPEGKAPRLGQIYVRLALTVTAVLALTSCGERLAPSSPAENSSTSVPVAAAVAPVPHGADTAPPSSLVPATPNDTTRFEADLLSTCAYISLQDARTVIPSATALGVAPGVHGSEGESACGFGIPGDAGDVLTLQVVAAGRPGYEEGVAFVKRSGARSAKQHELQSVADIGSEAVAAHEGQDEVVAWIGSEYFATLELAWTGTTVHNLATLEALAKTVNGKIG